MVKQRSPGAKFFIRKTICLVCGVHSNQILWMSVYLLPCITAPSSCGHCAGGAYPTTYLQGPLSKYKAVWGLSLGGHHCLPSTIPTTHSALDTLDTALQT